MVDIGLFTCEGFYIDVCIFELFFVDNCILVALLTALLVIINR